MTKTPKEQAIDNENRIAMMAAIIYAGTAAHPDSRVDFSGRANTVNAQYCVAVAKAIQKEAGNDRL